MCLNIPIWATYDQKNILHIALISPRTNRVPVIPAIIQQKRIHRDIPFLHELLEPVHNVLHILALQI